LVRLDNGIYAGGLPVRLHTHDEVLIEVREHLAKRAADELRSVMQQGFSWSQGLPLMSEETIAPYYTKRA
jgi:DNA polymerase I-like protein with 3'-5' exonuclease and polymerase domains